MIVPACTTVQRPYGRDALDMKLLKFYIIALCARNMELGVSRFVSSKEKERKERG